MCCVTVNILHPDNKIAFCSRNLDLYFDKIIINQEKLTNKQNKHLVGIDESAESASLESEITYTFMFKLSSSPKLSFITVFLCESQRLLQRITDEIRVEINKSYILLSSEY